MLYPFTYSNGILDLNYIDNFEADVVTGGEPPIGDDTTAGPFVKNMGGLGLVRSLGPNMIEYVTNWMTNNGPGAPDAGSIQVYTPGSVIRVQAALKTQLDMYDTYTIQDDAPSSSEFVWGNAADNYRATWVFKTPICITFTTGGTRKYLSLYTVFSKDTD
jgi:hypothetical protein